MPRPDRPRRHRRRPRRLRPLRPPNGVIPATARRGSIERGAAVVGAAPRVSASELAVVRVVDCDLDHVNADVVEVDRYERAALAEVEDRTFESLDEAPLRLEVPAV